MSSRYAVFGGLAASALALTACSGSTLPLIFVERETAGIDVSGPSPAESESGHIVLGYKAKSAAVVPVAVYDSETKISAPAESAEKVKELAREYEVLDAKSKAGTASQADEQKKAETVEKLIAVSSKRNFQLVLSENNGGKDALSVLGQFSINGGANAKGVQVGLGKFFATGSAATVLAGGFAAQMGVEGKQPVVNDDAFEIDVSKTLTGVYLLANDFDTAGAKVAIVSNPSSGTAIIDSATGELTYEAGNAPGDVKFTYAVTNRGGTARGTVTIKVKAVVASASPAAPIAPARVDSQPLPAPRIDASLPR